MQYLRGTQTVLAGLLLALGLIGCSGESNNLADPVAGSRAVCEEVYSASECIPGRFIADATVNLDYECGRVKAVTGVDGSFACPKDTQVTFSIRNPDPTVENAKSITLGQTIVRKPALLCTPTPNNNCSSSSVGRLYITPATLTSDSATQKNMVRLLLALSRDSFVVPLESPAHRMVLVDSDKREMEALAASVLSSDFSKAADESVVPDPDSFDALVAPFLAALTPPVAGLPSVADAEKVISRAQRATSAGVYSANSLASGICLLGEECRLGTPGLTGETPLIEFAADTWIVVDRKGRMIGYGLYAKKDKSVAGPLLYACNGVTSGTCVPSRPLPMILQNPSEQNSDLTVQKSTIPDVPLWPLDGRLKALNYKLQNITGQSVPQDPASGRRTLTFFSGLMERGAIAANSATYTNLFGDNPDSSSELGQWQLDDSTTLDAVGNICPAGSMAASALSPACNTAGNAGHKGVYTLMYSAATTPTLDPQLWENAVLNDPLLPKIQFPINMEITFQNSNVDATGENWARESLGTIYVSILRDGNIVTNLDYDPSVASPNCNANINPDTLISTHNGVNTQQYPVGVVQNISRTTSDDSIPNEVFITPLLMVTDKAVSAIADPDVRNDLAFIQLQSNLNKSLVIRIGSKDDVKPKLDSYSVSVDANGSNGCNAATGCAIFGTMPGWAQSWRTWRSLGGDTNIPAKNIDGIVVTKPAAKCYP